MVFSKPEGVRVTFFPCNIYLNSERTSQLKPWTTRELQDIEGFSAQNVSCLWYDFIPRDGDLKSGDFFSDQHPPPIEFVNAAPPRKCLFWFRPLTPPPFQVILQEKCGSICQWLQLVEYSSNQTLPYIGVTNKKLSSFCLEWTTCITQENETRNEIQA